MLNKCEIENTSFQTDDASLKAYKGTDRHITIPEGITTIQKEAFFKNSFLETLIFPESLTVIEEKAFYGCKNLKAVQCNNQLERIESFAFADCENLKVIDIPHSLRHIGNYAFSCVFGKPSLETQKHRKKTYITLSPNVEVIGEGCFLGADGIIVYDTFYAHEQKQALESHLGKALYDPEKASGHWTDSIRFKAHLILTKNSSTDCIESAVWMSSKEERREYLNQIIALWENVGDFDYEKYDALFVEMISPADQINSAFYRLLYPHALQEQYKNMYEKFLKNNAIKALDFIEDAYMLKFLKLLAEKDMFSSQNINQIFEKVNQTGNTACVTWLMAYKNKTGIKNNSRLRL